MGEGPGKTHLLAPRRQSKHSAAASDLMGLGKCDSNRVRNPDSQGCIKIQRRLALPGLSHTSAHHQLRE